MYEQETIVLSGNSEDVTKLKTELEQVKKDCQTELAHRDFLNQQLEVRIATFTDLLAQKAVELANNKDATVAIKDLQEQVQQLQTENQQIETLRQEVKELKEKSELLTANETEKRLLTYIN
jgi:di/tripeptidase